MKKMNFNFFNRKGNISEENSNEKLERFTKKKKEKNIIVAFIIGVVLVIGGIVLYRSYALYEEKQNFDVLQGKIGDFRYDVKMAVTVDGQTVDKIPDKGLYDTTVTCNGTGQGSWDYITWNLTLAGFQTGERCLLAFTSNPNLKEEDLIANGVALRRNTYRGKNITNYWNGTEKVNGKDLYKMIIDGTFEDIYVGDYIIDGANHKWLIADIDNYLYSGAPALIKHHVTIIPAATLMTAVMDDKDYSVSGYYGSKMVQETLPSYLATYVTPTFGNHVLAYQNLLINEYDVNKESVSGWAWYERQIDLMNEMNIRGSASWAGSSGAAGFGLGVDTMQYAIFKLKPEMVNKVDNVQTNYWLKDQTSSISFAVSIAGTTQMGSAKNQQYGVYPRFLIG